MAKPLLLAVVHLTVATSIWKVMILLADGSNDLSRIDTPTHIIAVDTPNNNNSVSDNWKNYRTSISTIEAAVDMIC